MGEPVSHIGITSTFVDNDAGELVRGVVKDVVDETIPNSEVACIVSTRARGDNPETDKRLAEMEAFLAGIKPTIPLIEVSARQEDRIPNASPTMGEKNSYDKKVIGAIKERCGCLPAVAVMVGDMIIHGPEWCNKIPSLNLHPDLPLSMGGIKGIYWNVIGQWILENRQEAGGMMHLAIPSLDAGTPVTYFRIPLKGIINSINLESLWKSLPADRGELERLIRKQTELKDKPTHALFIELRQAEAQFETSLIRHTLIAFAHRDIVIEEGSVLDRNGRPIPGLDLTKEVVGSLAIWPGGEGNKKNHIRKERK